MVQWLPAAVPETAEQATAGRTGLWPQDITGHHGEGQGHSRTRYGLQGLENGKRERSSLPPTAEMRENGKLCAIIGDNKLL